MNACFCHCNAMVSSPLGKDPIGCINMLPLSIEYWRQTFEYDFALILYAQMWSLLCMFTCNFIIGGRKCERAHSVGAIAQHRRTQYQPCSMLLMCNGHTLWSACAQHVFANDEDVYCTAEFRTVYHAQDARVLRFSCTLSHKASCKRWREHKRTCKVQCERLHN